MRKSDLRRSAIDRLRNLVEQLDYEEEHLLQPIASEEGLRAYYDLWATYDTDVGEQGR